MGRLWDMLTGQAAPSPARSGRHDEDELRLAAAALLVEVASVDRKLDDQERDRIRHYARTRLGLDESETEALIAAATRASAESAQLYGFTRVIKDNLSYEERVSLIETLWEVIYADGKADPYESQLVRRIGGLIYVTDRDRGQARKRVLERLRGQAGTAPPRPRSD